MRPIQLKTALAALVAVVGAGGLPAQPPPSPEARPRPGGPAPMAEAEAQVAKVRDLVRPRPGEHVANMEKIAWEHDPWEAAAKAGREGKPVLAWGECGAGVPCGYG